jgi:hydrogenase maturation protease
MKVLVLGLGNILLSDEGVGVRAVERLGERHILPPVVELLDGGTCGMDLLDQIAGRDALIVVDAIKSAKRAPGDVTRLAGDDIDQFFRTRLSPHQLGLSEVLAGLDLVDGKPAEVVIIGVVPASLDLGLELSPEGERGCEAALAQVIAELARLGVPPVAKLPAALAAE